MKGRRPKPTFLKLVTGNPGKRKLNRNEPKPKSVVLSPPEHLDRLAVEEWGRVAPELARLGLLTRLDVGVLAAYCTSWSVLRTAERLIAESGEASPTKGLIMRAGNGTAIPSPLVAIANRARADVVRYAVEMGMTPSARSRIDTTKTGMHDEDGEEFFR